MSDLIALFHVIDLRLGLDEALALRRVGRARRSARSRKGWITRRDRDGTATAAANGDLPVLRTAKPGPKASPNEPQPTPYKQNHPQHRGDSSMSLFSRLFGRKASFADHRRANDWKPGDLAVCIDGADWRPVMADDPAEGDVLRVTAVKDKISSDRRSYYLYFAEKAPERGWEYTAFRKPVEDSEPAEEEFTALIKRPVRKTGRVRA
jgi:hypothetical protein